MKVTVTARLPLPIVTVHVVTLTESQPVHPPKPVVEAVNTTEVFVGNDVLHVLAQPRPAGELVIVPAPLPTKLTVSAGPTKHTTLAVMFEVTIDPDDGPALIVAEINALPHARPAAVSTPLASTVAISGVFEAQVA